MLKISSTVKETKQILNKGQILVNNTVRRKHRFPVGLFDVVSIPTLNEHYRITINKLGKLDVVTIPEKEASIIPLKITNKTSVKGNKSQINLNNGWNILHDKKLSVGDVVIYDFKAKKIAKVIERKKGNTAFIFGGKYSGQIAELKEIKETGKLRKVKLAAIQVGKETRDTPLEYIFMIGEKKPELTL
jgi:small subunit ribosomal protein S4e